jgi:hypothetical protein
MSFKLKTTYTPFCTTAFDIIDIKELFDVLKFESTINVANEVLDFNPIYTCKVYVPKIIPDNKKRNTYRNIIHNLVYLNPTVKPIFIYSYIYFINIYHAHPSMKPEKLIEFFHFIYDYIIQTETVKPTLKLKRIHFNTKSPLSGESKNEIANKLNGIYRRKIKIDAILDAKDELNSMGHPVTTKSVSIFTGIKLRTVQLYFKVVERIDFDQEIQSINDTYE